MWNASPKLTLIMPAVAAALAIGGLASRAYSTSCEIPTETASLTLERVEVDGEPVDGAEAQRNYELYVGAGDADTDSLVMRAVRSTRYGFRQRFERVETE